jgi:hypothetical protein
MTARDNEHLLYLGFDDTDTKDAPKGTGRMIRDFCAGLDARFRLHCVLRHQLPRLPDIPFTSNNSSACAVIGVDDPALGRELFDTAAAFLSSQTPEGSDPGLCLSAPGAVTDRLVAFALDCNGRHMTQKAAMDAATGLLLAGVGGTNDGLIGAAAAVGLTRHGWCGRFIELGAMRSLPPNVRVKDLVGLGIQVVSVDRDPLTPLADDTVATGGWLRPSLWAGQPVLQVRATGQGRWITALAKKPAKAA